MIKYPTTARHSLMPHTNYHYPMPIASSSLPDIIFTQNAAMNIPSEVVYLPICSNKALIIGLYYRHTIGIPTKCYNIDKTGLHIAIICHISNKAMSQFQIHACTVSQLNDAA